MLLLAATLARGAAPAPSPFIAVGEAVRPAVVNIRCTRSVNAEGVGTGPLQEMYRRFFPDQEGQGGRFELPSTGSGFVVDAGGEILTNHHVIDGAEAIFVRFSGEKREYRAELVGTDPNTDLALLRIDPAGRGLPVLEFADSDVVQVGSWAVAVGNPFGNLESTLTVGVVSALGRGDLVIGGLTPRYQDFIQTDAAINFGNSGGPLVDVAGRVIGVNTAINQAGQGIGFAVPSNLVRRIWSQLHEHGRVIRGYLGVTTEDVVQVVGEEVAGEPEGGARVVAVQEDGPAAQAGLRDGDIIVEYAGRTVASRRDLQFLVADTAPGGEVTVGVVRGGRRLDLSAVPTEWTQTAAGAPAAAAGQWLGLEMGALAGADPRIERLKQALGIVATAGVMAVAVEQESPAADAGIRPGDVLVSIEEHELVDLAAWERARNLLAGGRAPLTVLVRTGASERYVTVKPRPLGSEN
ncbi:MAG: trypsin-like peptidase domain-containing protein [Candidatus Krumholzibacteriia bacterium]